MKGTSHIPQMPRTAAYLARIAGSGTALRSSKYPTYRRKRNSVKVRRASQVHHVPQIGLPQMGPVVSTMAQKMVPTSADEAAKRSSRGALVERENALARPTRIITISAQIAAGTCHQKSFGPLP